VQKVIPIAWRRWRKQLLSNTSRTDFKKFYHNLRAEKYDLVIDAQSLVKSALCAMLARGESVGLNWKSARESLAALCYRRTVEVNFQQHAITRMRTLFSRALGYELPSAVPDYGIDRKKLLAGEAVTEAPYLVFLHGTTWATKHWPEQFWIQLTHIANQNGFLVKLPWGNASEHERAQRIAATASAAIVLPRQDLQGMAKILAGAQAVAAVDTGLGHLTAALNVPAVSLYGPTNPQLTGALGAVQVHLSAQFPCAPCFSKVCTYTGNQPSALKSSPLYPACFGTLTPELVWGSLTTLL
jgi:heptosyltransferase-1